MQFFQFYRNTRKKQQLTHSAEQYYSMGPPKLGGCCCFFRIYILNFWTKKTKWKKKQVWQYFIRVTIVNKRAENSCVVVMCFSRRTSFHQVNSQMCTKKNTQIRRVTLTTSKMPNKINVSIDSEFIRSEEKCKQENASFECWMHAKIQQTQKRWFHWVLAF